MLNNIFRKLRSSSITLQLTLFYSISAFVILLLISLFLYSILLTALQIEDEQLLRNEMVTIKNIIQQKSDNLNELKKDINEVSQHRYAVRILDKNDNEIFSTNNMLVAANLFGPAAKQKINIHPHTQPNQKDFLLACGLIESNNKTLWEIQIALDVQHERNVIIKYRNNLILMLVLGIICFSLIGAIVARRGTQPLHDITKTAENITVSKLNARINSSEWPKEIRGLANAFNNMLERMENSFNRLSQFSADLAHELRTPINNIMGEAEIALSKPRPLEEYRYVLESNLEELNHLSSMIESLLFLARSENPQTEIHRTPFLIKPILIGICEFHEAVAAEQGVNLACEGGDELLQADLILFRRAVNNLVSNALKNTPMGGTVTLKVEKQNHQYITVTIHDTGIGIPAEHLPNIFDRFYRVDAARSKHSGGTGLGLAIVRSIMELHGGKIAITSQIGEGTTVVLSFPVV